MELVIIYI